jgi:hypothetical protein
MLVVLASFHAKVNVNVNVNVNANCSRYFTAYE